MRGLDSMTSKDPCHANILCIWSGSKWFLVASKIQTCLPRMQICHHWEPTEVLKWRGAKQRKHTWNSHGAAQNSDRLSPRNCETNETVRKGYIHLEKLGPSLIKPSESKTRVSPRGQRLTDSIKIPKKGPQKWCHRTRGWLFEVHLF